jgi:hypothetical protein
VPVAAALAALAVVAAAVTPAVVTSRSSEAEAPAAAAAAAPAPAAAAGKLTCPSSTYPTRDSTGYAVAFTADIVDIKLENGFNENPASQIWQSEATNITAQACGLLALPSLQATIQPEGLLFDTSKAKILTRVSPDIPIFNEGDVALILTPDGVATTSVDGVQPAGALDLTATTPLRARVINGKTNPTAFDCPTVAKAALSTGRHYRRPDGRGPDGPTMKGLPAWTVEGTPLTGALVGATAQVVGNDFPLPLFIPSDACSFAEQFNGVFSGADKDGVPYISKVPYGRVHPPGASWATGTLRITSIDPGALANGPPSTLPGT